MSRYNKLLFLLFIFVSALSFGQTRAKIAGVVTDSYGVLPGALVSIEGYNKSTKTDIDGAFSFEVDEGEYILSASFVMYNVQYSTVVVKAGETKEINFKLETGFSADEPISLGTRSDPVSSFQNTASVDIISPQQITNSSQIELSQILHYLAPSFHSTHQTIADGTDHIDPATLRGLGTDQVLVLINGKRRHNSSLLNVNGTIGRGAVGTDFNAIPVSAIERVEILRDGATSQYGSDAIAGVINIVLKKQTNAITLDNLVKINQEGDGLTQFAGANFGMKIGEEGFLNLTGEYRKREATNRAGNYTGSVYVDNPEEDANLIEQNDFYNQTGYSDRQVMQIGNAETQNLAIHFNGEIKVSDSAQVYLNGGRNYREGKSAGFYRFPKDEDRVITDLFPNGFSPQILTDIQDDAVTLGIKGVKREWTIDFSHSIGKNSLDYTVNNSNNASMGVASPTTFYAGGFLYSQNTSNIDLSKSFDWRSGLNFSFGAELRVENYQIGAGEEASYIDGGSVFINQDGEEIPRIAGAQVFPGIQPDNELNKFRTNSSFYVDVEANVTDQWLVQGAARNENYNNFGNQIIWKLASRYKVYENTSIRGGVATGFRAPSLHQVFFQNISTQFIDGDIVQVGTFNNESALTAQAFNVDKLRPELSNHYSAGLSSKINANLSVSLDYYYISIKDRIVLSGRIAEGYENILDPFGVGAAQFFTNAIDTKTSGFDASVVFKKSLGLGNIESSLGFNVNNTKVGSDIRVPEAFEGAEEVIFNREEIGRLEKGQPSYKLSFRNFYDIQKFRIQLNNTLFGPVEYFHPEDANPENWVVNDFTGTIESRDQKFSPKIITDLSVDYQFSSRVRAAIGGNNILNVYPDKHTHSSNTGNGNFVYSRRVGQFGVQGANYFVKVAIKL
ncbi:TonB-dependent receptor [uncultured Dokdonia sp.]|uniref:TonB-dependent receptor n=1 Tax=uncultured Dokdonia sp. TaxID=575653 RepID=UPI0026183151|nr:TonB-dependent receptor [uncultured Dokdonia sp.]